MGYDKPNYTQTPNKLFAQIPDMTESELRVLLVVCRRTFGWHKDRDRISISQLERATGMSRQGVINGIQQAMERDLLERFEVKGGYEYSLVVNEVDQQVVKLVDPQKKGSKDMERNKPDLLDGMLKYARGNQELDQHWMPPDLRKYLIPFQRAFFEDKGREPSKSERGYWIKVAREWHERGYDERDVSRAYNHCKGEGTAIKSPQSITWAFDELGSVDDDHLFGRM